MDFRTRGGNYPKTFKVQVVKEVESGKLTCSGAKRKYDILGHTTVLRWCRQYGNKAVLFTKRVNKMTISRESQETLYLKNEIKALKQELEDARMKNVVWETFVDIAEKELGIPIRKKFGARQSDRLK